MSKYCVQAAAVPALPRSTRTDTRNGDQAVLALFAELKSAMASMETARQSFNVTETKYFARLDIESSRTVPNELVFQPEDVAAAKEFPEILSFVEDCDGRDGSNHYDVQVIDRLRKVRKASLLPDRFERIIAAGEAFYSKSLPLWIAKDERQSEYSNRSEKVDKIADAILALPTPTTVAGIHAYLNAWAWNTYLPDKLDDLPADPVEEDSGIAAPIRRLVISMNKAAAA